MEDESTTTETTGTETDATTQTEQETVTRAEHQRELDRYRNELGSLRKSLKEIQDAKAALEDAQRTEAEKLAVKAKRAEELEPELTAAQAELESLRTVLTAEVESQAKALPKALRDLLPEGSPAAQLEWIRKARASAEELGKSNGLAPHGGRNPGQQKPSTEPTETERKQAAAHYAGRF